MATYTIPPGLTFKQKKAMAALLACRPCCGAGGSGSGSGGSGIVLCCDTSTPTTISWEITGTTGSGSCVTGTEAGNDLNCLIDADDLSAANACGPASSTAAGVISYTETCVETGVTTTLTISLCCLENDGLSPPDPAFAPRYRLAIYLTVDDTVSPKTARWCTQLFEIGSCDPFHLEVNGLSPYIDEFGGALASVVIT